MSGSKMHPGVAVAVVAAAVVAIFGVMYFLSEAPMSKIPQGPNFGVEGGMSAASPRSRSASGTGGGAKKPAANAPKADTKVTPKDDTKTTPKGDAKTAS